MSVPEQATAFAPASVGNVAVGYDILGHALEGAGDEVSVRRIRERRVRIVAIEGIARDLPRDPEHNTAGRALLALLRTVYTDFGFEVMIRKGIPIGSGLGGSAASATAALVAANALLENPLPPEVLYPCALEGEAAASGGLHGDNVAPQLLGGLVLATDRRMVPVPVPPGLTAVAVHPRLVVKTRIAREALSEPYPLKDFVSQSTGLALVLAGCFRNETELIAEGLRDVLVEPRRAGLIPGFFQVKQAALDHGALGASISGAGPSVFGWFDSQRAAHTAASAMVHAFAAAGLEATARISPVDAPGAHLVDSDAGAWP